MIIYRENQPPLLSDYGIEVPMLKGRAEKVKEELEKNFGSEVFIDTASSPLTDDDFARVHTGDFLKRCESHPAKVIEETFELINPDGSYHRYNPTSAKKGLSSLVPLFKESCADSYLCMTEAFRKKFSYYLGGGYHHSLSSRGRGFCLFNDIMIGARKFQKEVLNGPVWVIDIDAHKGCGTAEICEKDETVQTLSIHMKKGWPLDSAQYDPEGKLHPWFIPSTVDVGVDSNQEEYYLTSLEKGLQTLEAKSHSLPALCIVVDGSDPYEGDALPSADLLKLTKEQCLKRNLLVYNFLKERNIPQAYLMSGGYGEKNWIIHFQFISHVLKDFKKG
jgi:acetoin utilization deacetylase AcuC-like enzyme